MTNKHDEAQALLERCVNMLQAWHKGLPPKPAGFHFLMADVIEYKKRHAEEIAQLDFWEHGKPVTGEKRDG